MVLVTQFHHILWSSRMEVIHNPIDSSRGVDYHRKLQPIADLLVVILISAQSSILLARRTYFHAMLIHFHFRCPLYSDVLEPM